MLILIIFLRVPLHNCKTVAKQQMHSCTVAKQQMLILIIFLRVPLHNVSNYYNFIVGHYKPKSLIISVIS